MTEASLTRLARWLIAAFVVVVWSASLLTASALGQWFEYTPSGSVNGQGILREVMSRCPEYGLSQIRQFDKATQAHEATHFVDGEISQTFGQNYGAFYTGDGKCYFVPAPKTTTGEVARHVPEAQRTSLYEHYLQGKMYVGRNCLSMLDEWTCYTNDAECTRALNLPEDGGLKRALEFSGFADVLVQVVESQEPDYAGLAQLKVFVEWQKARVAQMAAPQHEGQSWEWGEGEWSEGRLALIPQEFRYRNPDGSCVHLSTAHIAHYMGEHAMATDYVRRFRGGESPSPHRRKLEQFGFKFAMTTDADDDFLNWCLENRYMVGITTKPMHCLNLLGKVERDGKFYAVLLDNNRPQTLEYEPWDSWYRKYKRSGWAFTLLSGEVPPPIPTGVVPLWESKTCSN